MTATPAERSLTIPQSVREVIGRRLDRLSELCNRTLTLCAVIGREFNFEIVQRLGVGSTPPVAEDALLDALDEAVAARVLVELSGAVGRYSFSHALIRQTLYDELTRRGGYGCTAGSARCWRRSTARTPSRTWRSWRTTSVRRRRAATSTGRSSTRSGPASGPTACWRTKRRSSTTSAPSRCSTRWRRPIRSRRLDLLIALGNARRRAGAAPEAMDTLRQAIALADESGSDREGRAGRAGIRGCQMGGRGLGGGLVVRTLEPALGAMGDEATACDRGCWRTAPELSRVARCRARTRSRESASLAQEAITLARRVGDPVSLAIVLHSRLEAVWDVEHAEERLAVATEVLHLADSDRTGRAVLAGPLPSNRRAADALATWMASTQRLRPTLVWSRQLHSHGTVVQ